MTSTLGPIVATALCGLPFALAAHSDPPAPSESQDGTREQFLALCASCHGPEGDGQGVTDLDRKARSFKDGGFSYGNTPKTVQRTITTGIPGTPMPAFGEAITQEEIAALANYVIELGPGLPPPPKNTEMVVKDRPLIVRGMLPPIADGALTHPRGLLIGRPDGFTFEYRTDDVRLLGMRQGRFVDRTDWVGRGGTGLQPLGKVVTLVEGGNPEATFTLLNEGKASTLEARLLMSQTRRIDSPEQYLAQLAYKLVDQAGARVVDVVETVAPVQYDFGSGYRRQWILIALSDGLNLGLRGFTDEGLSLITESGSRVEIRKRALPHGGVEYTALTRTIVEKRNWPRPQEVALDLRLTREDITILQATAIVVPAESMADFDETDVIDEMNELLR